MPHKAMPTFESLTVAMQQLIKESTINACDYANDMSLEPGVNCSLNDMPSYTETMLVAAIDPDNAAYVLCDTVKQAIKEYVNQSVGFAVIFPR